MNNRLLCYNNSLNFTLKQVINSVDDLIYNMQSLKQFQYNIDCIQSMKDKAQIQMNMTALALLRSFLLNEPEVGIILFCNLIRRFHQLSDEKIIKYCERIKKSEEEDNKQRSGTDFVLNGCRYIKKRDFFIYDWNHDFHNHPDITDWHAASASYRDAIMKNEFTLWDWDLVKDIYRGIKSSNRGLGISQLLYNRGFIAQLGMDNIEKVFDGLQEITGNSLPKKLTDCIKRDYESYKPMLYSYLSLSKDFIIQRQNELDWTVLQRNPRIQWNLELINMLLKKIRSTVCETKWDSALQGTQAMYAAIENLLNDEILNDIEKLYDI